MMVAAADANKPPSVLPEQSNDLAHFHASRMRRDIRVSAVVSLQVGPAFRLSTEQQDLTRENRERQIGTRTRVTES